MTIDSKALKEFALLLEGTDIKDIWLLYTNGNHYDAFISVDDPLITIGRRYWKKIDVITKENRKASMSNVSKGIPKGKCQRPTHEQRS